MKTLALLLSFAFLSLPESKLSTKIQEPPQEEVDITKLLEELAAHPPAPPPQHTATIEVMFAAPIDGEHAQKLVEMLDKASEKADSVVLVLNTPGGDFDTAVKLSQYLERYEKPLVCVADGEVASAGLYILESCPVRKITQRTYLMAHNPYFTQIGKAGRQDLEELLSALKAVSRRYVEQCAARSKLTVEQFEAKILHRDWWIGPQEALRVGLVDEVLESPNRSIPSPQRAGPSSEPMHR